MSSARRNRSKTVINGPENLEGRELLTGGGIYGLDGTYYSQFEYQKLLAKLADPPAKPPYRRVEIALPEYGPNAKAVFTLYGPGTIMGDPKLTPGTDAYNAVNTHVDANGQLHILFDGTTSESQIIGAVSGTRKNPQIAEIRDVDVEPFNNTGVGTNQMGYVNLARFDLAPGGRVNFSAGVQRLMLNNIGPGTQLDLAALAAPPTTSPQNPGGLNTTTTTSSSGSSAVASGSGQKTITTTVNGITVITTLPTTDQLAISNGELTGVGGITLPGSIPSTSGNTRVEVQGVELIVKSVNGAYSETHNNVSGSASTSNGLPSTRIGQEMIAGLVDISNTSGVEDSLVFYNINRNTSNWTIENATESTKYPINLPDEVKKKYSVSNPTDIKLHGAGVGQFIIKSTTPANNGSSQVVAVGYSIEVGSLTHYFVNVYSVIDGGYQGFFEVSNPFDGVGGSNGDIYLTDSTGGTNDTGITYRYDLTASLKAQTAEATYEPLNYPADFKSLSGTTGVTGISYTFSAGLSYFQPYVPMFVEDPQLGGITIGESRSTDSVTSITNYNLVNQGTKQLGDVQIPWNSTEKYSMGSVDQNLAIFNQALVNTSTSLGNYYTVQMYDPDTFTGASSFILYIGDETKLNGLSESFYPDLYNSSVIDVKGNLKTFSANTTDNMVLNVNGIANYTRINRAANTTIIAHPVLHLAVSWKPNSNVNIVSSERPTDETPGGKSRPGTRGGVQVIKELPILGPFVNPRQLPG